MALTGLTNLQPLHIKTVGIGTFDNTVSIGGTLTYEDVTNVDAIGIVTARSGVNVSGGQLDVGSNIKLGNAGVITATSFVGNIVGGVTGNISIPESIVHTGDTNTRIAFIADETISFDTNGSEKLRITGAGSLITSNIGIGTDNRWKIRPNASNQELSFEYSTSPNLADTNIKFRLGSAGQFGIGNAVNYGSSGQVLTSGGASGAVSWTTVSGTTINSNTNNYLITGTGTANTLQGEANLTFDGARLDLNNSGGSARLYLVSGNSDDSSIYFGRQNDGATAGIRYEHSNDSLNFYGYNNSERLRIDSNGKIIVASGTLHASRVLAKFGIDCQGLNIYDGVGVVANYGMAFYNDPTTDKANGIGFFNDDGQTCGGYIVHQDKGGGNIGDIVMATSATSNTPVERLRITSSGQLRAGDESSSDRTSYRHQFSSTAGSGDVLSIQNPSNTDGQGIGLGFWARNTNNAAIEVGKIKAVADETQANSTQAGSLRFLTNKGASMGERMQINSAGNVRITGGTHSSSGTSAGNVPFQIVGGGNNVITMFLGNGSVTGNGVNDYSADIRFNGAGVAWGDLSYYPNGNSNGGAFRFTGNGSTVASQGDRSIGCSGVFINGTSQNQHLDDYEEGSYTPNVQTDNGVNCGMLYAQGYYVKVGKVVTVHLKIETNSHNSVNTTAQYKVSLPYTSQQDGDTQGTLMCSIWSIGSSSISWMGGQVHNNNAWTHLAYHNGNNNNTNNLQPNVANNQLQFRGTVVYRSNT